MLALTVTASSAQIKTTGEMELGYPDRNVLSIPKEFTFNNVPLLTMYDNTEDRNLLVYDENIDLVKTIKIRQEKSFDYQLTYQDEEREVASVSVSNEYENNLGMTFEQWIEREKMFDPTFTETKLTIVKEGNGDSLIIVDLENPYESLEQMYFNYNYFGKQYPKRYWRSKNGQMFLYYVTYSVTYTEWHVTGIRTEDLQETLRRIQLCNINLNYGDGRANYYFEASQTLFNDDEEFEYIIPKYELSAEGSGGTYAFDPRTDDYGDELIETHRSTTISEKSQLALVGFQVVSADGNILNDLLFDDGFKGSVNPNYAYVVTIGEKTYLAFRGSQNDKSCTVFYNVDRKGTNGIRKVNAVPARMLVSPTIVDRSEQITVELGENNNTREIVVVNAAGQTIRRMPVTAGQHHVVIPAQGLSQGLNVISTNGVKNIGSCKIIVK